MTSTATAIRHQQREEGLRFAGAIKVHTDKVGTTFGTFHTRTGDVEVIINDLPYAQPQRCIDWGNDEVAVYGKTYTLATSLADAHWWRAYTLYLRREWSPIGGNYLRVTTEGCSYGVERRPGEPS